MGRQINFYMNKTIETDFIEFVMHSGFIMLWEDVINKQCKKIVDISNDNERSWLLILYKEEYGELIHENQYWDRINRIKSPIIEFTKTGIDKNKNSIRQGRIWIGSDCVFNSEESKTMFIKDYNKLVRWIKKNVPYQEYYHNNHTAKGYINDDIKLLVEKGYRFSL